MAIELTHRATGSVMGSNRLPDTITVFVLRLPRKYKVWCLPADRITLGRQVCVDDKCVYAAALGQQPRVRDWRRWLDVAADEAVQNEGRRPAPASAAYPFGDPAPDEPNCPPTGIGCCSGRWWCMH